MAVDSSAKKAVEALYKVLADTYADELKRVKDGVVPLDPKVLESIRNFLKDNHITSPRVDEKLQDVVQKKILNDDLPEFEEEETYLRVAQ